MLVRIKRKLNEEPLESVVLGRQANPQKRMNVNDLRHALQETSLDNAKSRNTQVFRLLATAEDDVSLPANLLDTIARRKQEWGARARRLSPRKAVKSTFEHSALPTALLEGQKQQSKSQRQARIWNCRRVKVQGFNVLEFSGDDRGKQTAKSEPWIKRQPPIRRDLITADRMREMEQEIKARVADVKTTTTIKRARGWRQLQENRTISPPQGHGFVSPPEESVVPQQYAEMLKEYFGGESDENTPVNFHASSCEPESMDPLAEGTDTSMSSSSESTSSLPGMAMSSHFPSSSSGRDYVWDLYYCCGSEMEPDPNAVELTYESEEQASEAESEDSNKERDYSEEEEDEGDSGLSESDDDSEEGVLNKRMSHWKEDVSSDGEDEDDD